MERARLRLHACLLLISYAVSVLGNACYQTAGTRCIMCNPGYLLEAGKCLPCPSTGYQNLPHSDPMCKQCQQCVGIFQYKERCTPTRNAVCQCIPGKQCVDPKCTRCRNIPCPVGQELRSQKCMNCLSGTFNNGSDGICKPWRNCSVTLVNGTHTSDAVCDPQHLIIKRTTSAAAFTSTAYTPDNPETATRSGMASKDVAIITIASTSFIILCLVVFGLIFSGDFLEKLKNHFKQMPRVKQTEQEDACSCHYPEEEHGEEDPMTEEP